MQMTWIDFAENISVMEDVDAALAGRGVPRAPWRTCAGSAQIVSVAGISSCASGRCAASAVAGSSGVASAAAAAAAAAAAGDVVA